jgi:hypothetical protein
VDPRLPQQAERHVKTRAAANPAALALLALLAAVPATAERTDGLPGGHRIPFDALNGGGGRSDGGGFSLSGSAADAETVASSGGAFRLSPGLLALQLGSFSLPGGGGGSGSSGLGATKAYPVPYKPSLHTGGIRFEGLSGAGTIRVYTLDGELVRTLSYDGPSLSWDPVANETGDPLASNAYLYVAESGGSRTIGRLMVAR